MNIPNYIQLTADQYTSITRDDPDAAVNLVMDTLESATYGDTTTDIDTRAYALAEQLEDNPTQQRAVTGLNFITDDPLLYVASPDDVKELHTAIDAATCEDEDLEDDLTTLQHFYQNAAAHNNAIAILYN